MAKETLTEKLVTPPLRAAARDAAVRLANHLYEREKVADVLQQLGECVAELREFGARTIPDRAEGVLREIEATRPLHPYENAVLAIQFVAAQGAYVDRSHWDDDPDHPAADWQYEVASGDTRLGYADWVAHRREADGLAPTT